MGDPNAKIQITEYSDFQCPYCKRHYLEMEPLIEQYYIDTGKVLFTYRSAGNFVSQGGGGGNTESEDAEEAAYCAADQGKFWEMHDALFQNNRDVENQGSFFPRRLSEIANPLLLCVMQGGVPLAGQLMTRLTFPLGFDYVQVGRYGQATRGGALSWRVEPSIPVRG